MSTEFYLVCESHEPHIYSDTVGWNTKGLSQLRILVRDRENIVKRYKTYGHDAFDNDVNPHAKEMTVAVFLRAHENCELGIRDEYGETYSIEDDSEKPVPGSTKLGVVKTIKNGPLGIAVVFESLTEEGKKLFGIED